MKKLEEVLAERRVAREQELDSLNRVFHALSEEIDRLLVLHGRCRVYTEIHFCLNENDYNEGLSPAQLDVVRSRYKKAGYLIENISSFTGEFTIVVPTEVPDAG